MKITLNTFCQKLNDSQKDAEELVKIRQVRRLNILLKYNPIDGASFQSLMNKPLKTLCDILKQTGKCALRRAAEKISMRLRAARE